MNKDFYIPGSYKEPCGMYSKVTLTKPCPAGGHLSVYGVAVSGSSSKSANSIGWASVLAACAWAVKRSPAFLADLRALVAEADTTPDEAPAAEGGAA